MSPTLNRGSLTSSSSKKGAGRDMAAAASENAYLKRMAEHAPFYSRVGGLFDNFFDLFGEEEEGEEEDDD